MKKIHVFLVLLCFLSVADIFAQQGDRRGRGNRGPSPEYLAMVDSLKLDSDQKVQFDAVEKMYRDKSRTMMRTARENGEDRMSIRGEMEKMQTEKLMVLMNLFTDEQYVEYVAFLKKREANRANRSGPRGGRKGNRGQGRSGGLNGQGGSGG